MDRKMKITRLKQWTKICRVLFIVFLLLSIYSLLPREEMTLIAEGGLFWIIFAAVFGVQSVSLRLILDAISEKNE